MRGILDAGRSCACRKVSTAELYNGIACACGSPDLRGPGSGHPAGTLAAHESAGPADRAETELQSVLEWMEEGWRCSTRRKTCAREHQIRADRGARPGGLRKIKTLESAYRETGGTCRLAGAVRGTLA